MVSLAIGLLVLYCAAAFGLRMLVQWRLTGSTGFEGIGGRPGSLEWCAGMMLGIAVLGSGVSPVLVLLGVVPPLNGMARPVPQAVGLILFVFGFGVTIAAQLNMGRSWRIGVNHDEKTQLVTEGLFSVVRNPIFSAMLAAFLGLMLLVPTAVATCSWILLLTALELHVRCVEEPYLRRVHGDKYVRYSSRVGRFFPRLGTL